MDKQYFANSGIPPPVHLRPSLMPTWQSPPTYTMPLNAPSELHLPIMDHFVKGKLSNLGIPMAMDTHLPTISDDPKFTERAANFSCFGSRCFNERKGQLELRNAELAVRSITLMGKENIPRVSSSPTLKAAGSSLGARENRNFSQTYIEMKSTDILDMNLSEVPASDPTEFPSSNEGSSVSGQIPNRETVSKIPTDSNSKKRKPVCRGKSKVVEVEDDPDTKSCKSTEYNGTENGNVKTQKKTDENQKQEKTSPKPPEPPKDYIHVRARRGQATDSHSLAERVRREKIGERMKLLQDLVPGCNKVTGKALMLDEIINYVQSLQRQVEFLSMKLASVIPRLDIDMDGIISKDVSQPNNGSFPHPVFPLANLGSSASPSSLAVTQYSVHPLDTTDCQNIGTLIDEFGLGLAQFPTLCRDDLQSIVQMGLGRSPSHHMEIYSKKFPWLKAEIPHKK